MLDVNMSEVDDPRWKHAGMLLASHNKTKDEHFQLLANGSLLLRSGRSTDSGNYTVDVYDKRGRKTLTMTYGLLILGEFPRAQTLLRPLEHRHRAVVCGGVCVCV